MDNIKKLEEQIFKKIQKISEFFESRSLDALNAKEDNNTFQDQLKVLENQKEVLEKKLSNIKKEHSEDLMELNQIIDEIKLLLENSDARS